MKVLNFGSPESLLFAGGLTDFEYTVTYTNSRGETSVFTKPAGARLIENAVRRRTPARGEWQVHSLSESLRLTGDARD